MTDSIKPPWAFSVWANSDHIFCELPAIGGKQAHVVKLPNDLAGFRKLQVLARARDVESKIGTKGDPTQQQISKVTYDPMMVRRTREKLKFSAEQRAGARDVLRKLGMI